MFNREYFKQRLTDMRAGVRQVHRRKLSCKFGHVLHVAPSGQTRCAECERLRGRRRRAARPPVPQGEMVAADPEYYRPA